MNLQSPEHLPPMAYGSGQGASLEIDASMDAKTGLNQFCQRYCSRPVTKTDIVYTTTKFGSSQFQAIVKLNCMEGQEYAGELVANPKEAEKSAAQQALQAYSTVINTLPTAAVKKRKPPVAPQGTQVPMLGGVPPMAAAVPAMGLSGALAGVPGGLPGGLPTGLPGGLAGGLPGDLADLADLADPDGEGENPALTDKVKLNAACMKIAKRALQKGETFYETRQINVGKAPSGYQATVRLSCLPDEWADKMFAGQVCANKQRAEHSAANVALAAMMADPELSALVSKAAASPTKGGSRGRGKEKGGAGEKGEGKGKPWGGKGGWAWAPSGPDLPRERVSEAPVTGEVLEWKGSFGWIKPHTPVEHEQAAKRDGKVWAHRQDLEGGHARLETGDVVRFHVYADASGLGAEEIVRF